MVQCAIFGCNSNNNKKLKRSATTTERINFFSFPTNKEIRRQWISLCSRQDNFNVKNARICSIHFTNEDFQMPYNSDILGYTPAFKKLQSGAIPHKNLPKSNTDSSTIPNSSKQSKIRTLRKIFINKSNQSLMEMNDLPSTSNEKLRSEDNNKTCGSLTGGEDHEVILAHEENKTDTTLQKRLLEMEFENTCIRKQLTDLQQQYKSDVSRLEYQNNSLKEAIGTIFTPVQIKKLQRRNQKVAWSIDDISSSTALYASGSRAYRLLRKRGHPLPAVSTLRKWAHKIKVDPGLFNTSTDIST